MGSVSPVISDGRPGGCPRRPGPRRTTGRLPKGSLQTAGGRKKPGSTAVRRRSGRDGSIGVWARATGGSRRSGGLCFARCVECCRCGAGRVFGMGFRARAGRGGGLHLRPRVRGEVSGRMSLSLRIGWYGGGDVTVGIADPGGRPARRVEPGAGRFAAACR